MNDSQFLLWISDRLVNVYGENENTDFVLKLRELADKNSEPAKPKPLTDAVLEKAKQILAEKQRTVTCIEADICPKCGEPLSSVKDPYSIEYICRKHGIVHREYL